MVEIEKPRITCIDSVEDVSYGKYVVEPLERGYGMTLGNSLAMNFAFPQLGAENWEGAYALIAKTYADCDDTQTLAKLPLAILRRVLLIKYRKIAGCGH